MFSSAYVWAKVLGFLEQRLTTTVTATWFDDVEVLDLTNKHFILYSPSEFRRDIIIRNCRDHIQDALMDLFQYQDIEIVVYDDKQRDAFMQSSSKPKFSEFNPAFTFDTFVVGSSNRFSQAASIAVSQNPAGAYNPLLIYGQPGLGKTHLLHAIANAIREDHPNYNIVYLKGDQFTNELIAAVKSGRNDEFRSKYRQADLFLMDDIQFIAGKEATQEEFFHTFNSLYENHKQIVVTSDRPPHDMALLEDRLRSRLAAGLSTDIQPPDYETRMAIIERKAQSLGFDIPEDVKQYIAQNITNNVRQLEGTVNKIKAYKDLAHVDVNLETVKEVIKDLFHGKAETLPTPTLIVAEVCRYYRIEESVLRSTLKNKSTAEARQVAMHLIRTMTNLSLPDIGKEFGRDHTTVLYALKTVDKKLADPNSNLSNDKMEITAAINHAL
ncbi:MAG: chromosomal replication initiator protein DnaA [Eubacteriales bacterium]